jgi:hypothetical protein
MQKLVQVVMLPTEKTGVVGLINLGTQLILLKNPPYQKNIDRSIAAGTIKPQYLYFTIDEEIKGDDWCLYQDEEDIFIGRMGIAPKEAPLLTNDEGTFLVCDEDSKNLKKIVATTNPDLWITKKFSHYSQDLMKVAVYKDVSTGIAKIPTDFIEAYVREQGKITEVMLEYEYSREGFPYTPVFCSPERLKLRSNGEVIWSPVKERSFTYSEVIDILRGFDSYVSREIGIAIPDGGSWFIKNYPQ